MAGEIIHEKYPNNVGLDMLDSQRETEIQMLEEIYRMPTVNEGGGSGFPPIFDLPKVAELPQDPKIPTRHTWKDVARFILKGTFRIATFQGFLPESAPKHMSDYTDNEPEPNKFIAGQIPKNPKNWIGFTADGVAKTDRKTSE